MFCARCGTGMSDDAGFCPSCGAPVQRNQPTPPVYQAPPPPPVYQAPPPPPVYQAPPPPQPPQNWQPPQQPAAQPPQAWPPPPQGVAAAQLPYAGFWKRFAAYLIDSLILDAVAFVVFGVVILMIGGGAVLSGDKSIDNFVGDMTAVAVLLVVLMFFGLIVAVWLYFAKMESSPSQATIGKRVMGIYVTDLQGHRLTFGKATARFFSKIITGLIPLALGWIMAAFTEKRQALHDMIAGTLVMRRG
jgi:uncharacterized RDD family membrane protein YckC